MENSRPAPEESSRDRKRASRLPRPFYWLILICLVFLGIFLGGEILIRVVLGVFLNEDPGAKTFQTGAMADLDQIIIPDDDVMWVVMPDVENLHVTGYCWGRKLDFTLSTTDRGFRYTPEVTEEDALRILCIGDSVTFGLGVNDEEAWPYRLQEILNAGGNETVQVINAGVPGYTAFQGHRQLLTCGDSLAPDAVIACFGQNDFFSKGNISDYVRLKDQNRLSLLLLISRYLLYNSGILSMDTPRLTPDQFKGELRAIHAWCSKREIPVLFLIWPEENQYTEGWKGPINYGPYIAEVCRDDNIPMLYLYSAFAEKGASLYLDPVHAGAEGCRIAAEAIAETFRPLLPIHDNTEPS